MKLIKIVVCVAEGSDAFKNPINEIVAILEKNGWEVMWAYLDYQPESIQFEDCRISSERVLIKKEEQ